MILYVNGDCHGAGAEIANPHAFAEDDPLYWALGRRPHPDNLKLSYGCELANMLGAVLEYDAESASSNDRIIRTTYDYLKNKDAPDLVIIGWSTWEREEWWDEDTQCHWQVNAGGIGADWPEKIKAGYKNYIANIDMRESMNTAYNKIWKLHLDLQKQNIKHLFFNTFEPLSQVPESDWTGSYIDPYNPDLTYYNWCIQHGFNTVNPNSYHFGADAHRAWAEFLYQTYIQKLLTTK